MKVDPETTVSNLLAAIPSSVAVFEKLRIKTIGTENKTLEQVCADHGIALQQFLRAMDEIDWHAESPANKRNRASS